MLISQGCGQDSYKTEPTTLAPKLELPVWASSRLSPERNDRKGSESVDTRFENINGRPDTIPSIVHPDRVVAPDIPVTDSGKEIFKVSSVFHILACSYICFL